MTTLACSIHFFAKILDRVGRVFFRLGNLLESFLPALLKPLQMNTLLTRYYAGCYYDRDWMYNEGVLEEMGLEFESWEVDVCRRYGIDSGRMVVMGCGWGRESVLIAERKVDVVGLDRHAGVLNTARRLAKERKVPAQFLQADLLALPHAPKCFDFALLASTMYSAIPSLKQRQAWLRDLRRILKPEGLVIFSFHVAQTKLSRLDRLAAKLNGWLLRLPGANLDYQDGDVFQAGHFFHLFRGEDELRGELEGAGAVIRELNWIQQYAVISYPATC